MSENVVYLKFRNPDKTDSEYIEFVSCKLCKNKTYTLTYDEPHEYPLLKCAGCGAHVGRIGWTEEKP